MRDCPNVEMRELLPDLLHGELDARTRSTVEAHIAGCADCGRELALLTQARNMVRGPAIDASRIAARLPAYRPAPLWRRSLASPALRVAAALVLAAGGISLARRGEREQGPVAASPAPVVGATTRIAVIPAELAVGEPLTELTESDLHALVEELDEIDAITPAEAEVELPTIRSGA
jgi:anti-sigma factor RsiW